MKIIISGYGAVGRYLAELLAEKEAVLQDTWGLAIEITGITTGAHGAWITDNGAGLRAADIIAAGWPKSGKLPSGAKPFTGSTLEILNAAPADMLVEISPLNPHSGEPALSYVQAALSKGAHVVTANKGPIAHGLHELRKLAAANHCHLRYESTVIDGLPVINLAEFTLPATEFTGVRAIVNATSNYILSGLMAGQSFDETLSKAQEIGIAEADPSMDLDGWDASVKLTILANTLMNADIRPTDVERITNAELMQQMTQNAPAGATIKQIGAIWKDAGAPAGIRAKVALEILAQEDSLAGIGQGKAALQLQTDTMNDVTIIEGPGTPRQTAFGILADIITIARERK